MVFVIWGIVLGMFAVFSLRSRKEQGSILQRVSIHIYKKLSVLPMTRKRLHRQNTQLMQNLVSLHPGEMLERLLADYHVEKTYFFWALGELNEEKRQCLEQGVVLKGEAVKTKPAKCEIKETAHIAKIEHLFQEYKCPLDLKYNLSALYMSRYIPQK